MRLQGDWDIRSGKNKRLARDTNDAFVGAAASILWQDGTGLSCDVSADDGEIAIGEFKDVRACVPARATRGIGLRAKAT